MSEDQESSADAQRRRREMLENALDRINALIHTTVDPDEILERLVTEVVRATRADSAIIYLQEGDRWAIRHLYGLPEDLRGRLLDKSELKASERAMISHRVVLINDTAASDEVTKEMVERYGIKALLDSELIIGNGVGGDFAIHYHTGDKQFDEIDVHFMERVAAAVALALRNAALFDRLRAEADRSAFLSDLIEHSAQPFLVGYPDGHVRLANQAFTRLFGYAPEELEQLPWESLTHPAFAKEQRRIAKRLGQTREPQSFQTEYRSKEGRWIPVEVKLHLVQDPAHKPRYYYAFVSDITERLRVEAALREREARFRAVFDHGPMGMVTLGPDGVIQQVNPRFCNMLGYAHGALPGRTLNELTHPDDLPASQEAMRQLTEGSLAFYDLEKRYCRHDRQELWVQETGSVVRGADGAPIYYIAMQDDITERKRAEEKIRHMAHHDPLTGLPNRRLFSELLERGLSRGRRTQRPFAVMFVDLDHFKDVNDTFGHEAGDRLLQLAAQRLRQRVRRSDVVARVGGDEFNIILTEFASLDGVSDVARDLVDAFTPPFALAGHDLHVSATVGISLFPMDADDANALLRYADIAMYSAKQQGRNRFQFFNHEIDVRSVTRLQMENELRVALQRNEFGVFYQPLIAVDSGEVRAAEALVRWNHPRLGRLDPVDFISIAEEIGAMIAIDEWVLRTACREAAQWPPGTDTAIAVNLSARQFQRPDLPAVVAAILRETGLPPHRLQLEITENVAMGDIGRALPQMRELTEMGVRLVIDDFGSGYSALGHLKRMPIDRLKIDRSFVQDMASDADDRAIVTAVTALAHTLQIRVVAEGVETEEQFGLLRDFDCDEAQGYLFDAPLSHEQLRARLAEHPRPLPHLPH